MNPYPDRDEGRLHLSGRTELELGGLVRQAPGELRRGVLILAAMAAATSCGQDLKMAFPGPFGPPNDADVGIAKNTVTSHAYVGSTLVQQGTLVHFENQDAVSHTVTADDGSFDSGVLPPQVKWAFSFDNLGTIGVHCRLHPNEEGNVMVTTAQTVPANTTPVLAADEYARCRFPRRCRLRRRCRTRQTPCPTFRAAQPPRELRGPAENLRPGSWVFASSDSPTAAP